MSECRWSGWPGAWCLDCGRPDPMETMLADGEIAFDCDLPQGACTCGESDAWLKCSHFRPVYGQPLRSMECPEPGSDRHNPYKAPLP